MVINPTKSKYMVITTRQKHQLNSLSLSLSLDSLPIERVNKHKVLGVILDDHLGWQSHVDYICKKVSTNLFLLSKLRHFVDVDSCMIFFHAHILSYINYASTIWDCCSDASLKRVKSLYRRACKIIITDSSLSTDDKMKRLDILPLQKHLLFNKCVFMKKLKIIMYLNI